MEILPGVNIEVLLAKVCDNDCSVGELSACQCSQCLCGVLRRLVLEIDFAYASALARTTRGSRHLDVEQRTIFGTFLLDIFENFCKI